MYTLNDEHWVMYRIIESLYCTPETDIRLYVTILELETNSSNNTPPTFFTLYLCIASEQRRDQKSRRKNEGSRASLLFQFPRLGSIQRGRFPALESDSVGSFTDPSAHQLCDLGQAIYF